MKSRHALAALATDVACVLAFCALGRRSHAEGVTPAGVAETSWPFLSGTAVGWLLARGWRDPTAIVPTGVAAWISTVGIGMLLRRSGPAGAEKSTAVSFLVVASVVNAVLLLGWRATMRRGTSR